MISATVNIYVKALLEHSHLQILAKLQFSVQQQYGLPL